MCRYHLAIFLNAFWSMNSFVLPIFLYPPLILVVISLHFLPLPYEPILPWSNMTSEKFEYHLMTPRPKDDTRRVKFLLQN